LSVYGHDLPPNSIPAQERKVRIADYSGMKVGTPEHRDLFCRAFIDGHRIYEPEDLPWPQLESHYLERLRAIPFWGIARAMERKAGIMVGAFADTLTDPLIREAVAMQGIEESRHARIMTELIERYALPARDIEVVVGAPVKDDFVVFGYEECVDFFMGAGLYRLATQLDIFPANLVSFFEEVLFEEARHVTFFINWFRYEEARLGRDRFLERHIAAVKNYYRSIQQLVRSFTGEETTGFAAVNAKEIIDGMTPMMFLEAALAQNRMFLGRLDQRLVKPSLLPVLAGIALTILRALPPRTRTLQSTAPLALDRSVAA
jgi:hypothetical protein